MIRHVDTPQSRCLFGLARCDITPPVGIYHRMWGAATHDRSTGVHRPLTATAMVFRPAGPESKPAKAEEPIRPQPTDEQVLIAIDHCLLWAPEMGRLLAIVCNANALSREQVVVTFSHTHGAGLMDTSRSDLPGGEIIGPYLEQLGRQVAALVAEARDRIEAVTITYGTGRCALAAHRDFHDDDSEQWVCGFNPQGIADDAVLIARITANDDSIVATVINYGCHPTTLAWENSLISPDYPGALREVLEAATGAPCVFLLSPCGEIGPREGFVGNTAVADRNGRQLAYAALSTLEALPPPGTRYRYEGPVVSGATLGIWKHAPLSADELNARRSFRVRRWEIPLSYPEDRPTLDQLESERVRWQTAETDAISRGDEVAARDCHARVERTTRALTRRRDLPAGGSFPYPVTLLQLGQGFWITLEGEPYQLLQTTLRDRFPQAAIVISVIANGSRCSYLPPADIYGTGIYQESIAVLAPGCLEQLIQHIGDQIEQWLESTTR